MMKCTFCDGEEFVKDAGFMYCSICQTQSQEYQELEYDYHDHDRNVIRQRNPRPKKNLSQQTFYDDGFWTTWESFNYILYGMTQEMKKCGASKEFETMVLKLWAAYLKKCKAAFTSKYKEKIPKLGFHYKLRDARILYDFEYNVSSKAKRPRSKISNTSASSISSQSKRSLALQKGRIIASEYRDHLSTSLQNSSSLLEDNLNLLEFSDLDTTNNSSHASDSLMKNFKKMLNKKNYNLLKKASGSKELLINAKVKAKRDIKSLGKNKLLSLIHLALLLTGSQIQLSDLMRFIRESHLSYAKVTHFFPKGLKFPKKDFAYIEVISDACMPTHLNQRKVTNQLANLVKVEKILTPNMDSLVDRYSKDLNLPTQIAQFSKKILRAWIPSFVVPKSKTPLPSFETWAMASIIFVMKLLFGLNDETEIFLSRLARELNSARNTNYFVFEDWQKFIECRKVVLTVFHYPTQEQLGNNTFQSSKYFLDVLVKESKDEFRQDRFIPYPKYYLDESFLKGVKEMLNALSKSQVIESFEFESSLTPQTSHLKTIMKKQPFQNMAGNTDEKPARLSSSCALPEKILNQNFKICDVNFALDPKSYLNSLKENLEFVCSLEELPQTSSNKNSLLYDCPSNYWIFKYPDIVSGHLWNFKEEVLEKTPENFQWLIKECARMLEINVRDVYDELLNLELKLGSNASVS